LQDISAKISLVVVDVFEVGSVRHEIFGMPVLKRRHDEKRIVVVPAVVSYFTRFQRRYQANQMSKDILFEYNTQHDCRSAGCAATGKRAVLQERIQSGKVEAYIEHKPVDCFLINTHAFHNAHLIRSVLPRDITAPIPFAADRRFHHDQMAQKLRGTQESKRAKTALKAAERRKTSALQKDKEGENAMDIPQLTEEAGSSRKRKRGQHDEADNDVDDGE
jgi:hypothetical protein